MRIAMIVAAAGLALAACASSTETANTGSGEYQALLKDCQARGGELKPIGGVPAANDSANYACEFKGASPKNTG